MDDDQALSPVFIWLTFDDKSHALVTPREFLGLTDYQVSHLEWTDYVTIDDKSTLPLRAA